MSPRPAVRVGVLGCADIARRRMLPAFAASPDTEVVAVASRDADRAKALAAPYGARPVRGYAELLADASVDAVHIPLPLALHAEWTEAALRAGKHVLAEKPLTDDPARSAALFALAERSGLALMENVMFVHHRRHAEVARLVAAGAIGELRSFQAVFCVPRRPADDIRYRRELAGGALGDIGVYPLRAALHFLGPELEVLGAQLTEGPGFTVDTAGAVLLRTPAGVTAQLSFGLDHAYGNSYELRGSEGRLTVDLAFTPPAEGAPPAVRHGPSGAREVPLPQQDQVAATVTAFAAAVRAGHAPYEESLAQARLLEAVRRHAAAG
ncbi:MULTISPECIES: Gfo/Idh/MocA family protein [Streptomyces]|uniref:Gfo/Idh/MocA family protein n=1 Tax=Streptomyces TaxID=1883 RepID=UPI00158633C7|nr:MULTISPECIES: Gfo/Idh/MocA family oxidoreductase [Streptomyces]NUV40582.1 Gfo/Idh/MocA family oxidoreductase [Streptomyces sp. CAI-24]